jgi:hypothetical protein
MRAAGLQGASGRKWVATTVRGANARPAHDLVQPHFGWRRFKTHTKAKVAVFDFIEHCYNPQRKHSSLGYFSPA